jgi:phosphotransferase system enzyme I (PtsP)
MLRANIGFNNLQIMFPMISQLDEVDQAVALLQRAHKELLEEGHPVELPPVGVMVEVPAAVYQAEELCDRVDFLSIGTNDLTQYLLAVDRNNPRVANLYDELHPAVLRALKLVAEVATRKKKPLSVCGGMAGDPVGAILLIAMGVTCLSMSAAALLRVKWVIRSLQRADMESLLNQVLRMESPKNVRLLLNKALEEAGLGGLVRAGL